MDIKQEIKNNYVHLSLLKQNYPTKESIKLKISSLMSVLELPKGTEHFLSDIHGEARTFEHVLRNSSGSIRRKIAETFQGILSDKEQRELATIIYYPLAKLELIKNEKNPDHEWYFKILSQLITMLTVAGKKYTKKKRDSFIDTEYFEIISELVRYMTEGENEQFFVLSNALFSSGAMETVIDSVCASIRRMNIDYLHILGDIFDRGPYPDKVMDTICRFHHLDIQWGNHDIAWLGASCGSEVCCANVVRFALRYSNIDVLENGYGINLLPLMDLAMNEYGGDDEISKFMPVASGAKMDLSEDVVARMHKAVTIIQFKLESALYKRNPGFGMNHRDILSTMDLKENTVTIAGVEYKLNIRNFPTIDKENPTKLTQKEILAVNALKTSFSSSEKLRRHANALVSKGSMYKIFNGNLLFHGCIPMDDDGEFKKVSFNGKDYYSGVALMDIFDTQIKKAYHDDGCSKDFFWYAWASEDSPLFGKDKMATFERYFIDDEATHKESYIPYFSLREREDIAIKILKAFSLSSPGSKIVNGHVPVNFVEDENYVKANGRVLLIDGGFSRAYQKITHSAGVTLKYNSYGMSLIVHSPFYSVSESIKNETDIQSEKRFLPSGSKLIRIKDTDTGRSIKEEIYYLDLLLEAYKIGELDPNIE